MSQHNPYGPSASEPSMGPAAIDSSGIRQVSGGPIDLMKRGLALMGDQYWLFLGIVFVGLFLGTLVPFNIILGPMMVGIQMCFIQREYYQNAEFGTLFKGFDRFGDALIVTLIMMGVNLVAIIGTFMVLAVLGFLVTAVLGPDSPAASLTLGIGLILGYLVVLLVALFGTVPFLFSFHLIADRGLSATDALRTSWAGVRRNLITVSASLFVFSIAMFFASLMCYIPGLMLMPVVVSAIYVLYRDIFGPAQTVTVPQPSMGPVVPTATPVAT